MMLSILRLYSVNDRMINEYGIVDGMRICGGKLKYFVETYPSATLSTTNPT
jgi:hypothetical protein